MITDTVREYVRTACHEEGKVLGPGFFEEHVDVVTRCGVALARELGADPEIVELACLLHDIAAVQDIKALAEHARLGAAAAEKILAGYGYPQERTQKVCACILSHSVPLAEGKGSPEEICVSNADAVSQILKPAYWLYFVYTIRKTGFEAGRGWLQSRIESNWKGLVPQAKAYIGEETYASIARLV